MSMANCIGFVQNDDTASLLTLRPAAAEPDLSVWRPWAGSLLLVGRQEGHPACKNRVVGCWCGCLSEARCRQLYDLHTNSMTYTLFFIPDYQFQQVFLCFLR